MDKEKEKEKPDKIEKEPVVVEGEQKTPTLVKPKKENENENDQEPSLMHNLNVLALAASPEIRQMEEGRIKNAAAAPGSSSSSVDGEPTVARIGCVRKQFQAALESATPESQLTLHDYEMSTCHVNSSKQQKPVRSVKTRNRKTKSLAVISRRFLERLPLYPSVGDPVVLSLNHLPTELGVERRRIYDILNILESVEMVRRLGRNQYQYLGYARLPTALAELRHQGNCEGLRELIEIAERERREELAEKRERRKRENEAVMAAEKKRQLAAKASAAQRSTLSSAIELLASAAGKVECDESGVEDDDDDSSSSDDSSSPSSPVPAGENSVSSSTDVKSVLTAAAGVTAATRHLPPGQTIIPPGGIIVADHSGMVPGNDDAASLGVICRRFLMLLLVSEPPVVTLNTAARVVGCQASSATMPRQTILNAAGQPVHVEKENNGPSTSVSSSRYNSSTVFKSKLRRLYDVTNVLATVGLVKREVDGVPVDKDGEDGTASPSSSSSPSVPKDTKDAVAKEETKPDAASTDKKPDSTTAAEGATNSATNAERKLRGPVFRYTGPPISSLPPVSASRLSELPSSTGGHRQGSHAKSSGKCQLLVRNGSAVTLPAGSNAATPSLVIVPGSNKPLRIVASGPQVASAASGAGDDNASRLIVAPLGLARARTFTSGLTTQSATVVMPSTPLLAPPRLANFAQTQPSPSVRPNSLLGKLLGSQNPTPSSANGGPVPSDQSSDSAKRQKAPTTKRVVLSSDGDGFSAKQSRLSHPPIDPWPTQERIVVIGPSASANGGSAAVDANGRPSAPLIVSHAQLSMQKSSQHLQKPAIGDNDDEVVVVVQDQQANSAKIIVTEKTSPGSSRDGAEFLTSNHRDNNSNNVPGVKDVVDWLC